jgi:hypothetical protein
MGATMSKYHIIKPESKNVAPQLTINYKIYLHMVSYILAVKAFTSEGENRMASNT